MKENTAITTQQNSQKQKPGASRRSPFSEKKYRMGLHVSAIVEVDRIRTEHPEWGFREALTAILNDTDPNMELEHFREFVLHVVDTWEKVSLREAKETQAVSNGNIAKQARQYEEMPTC